jgi:hypothetical protein
MGKPKYSAAVGVKIIDSTMKEGTRSLRAKANEKFTRRCMAFFPDDVEKIHQICQYAYGKKIRLNDSQAVRLALRHFDISHLNDADLEAIRVDGRFKSVKNSLLPI